MNRNRKTYIYSLFPKDMVASLYSQGPTALFKNFYQILARNGFSYRNFYDPVTGSNRYLIKINR